eukprot:jgi/Botrbrau1/13850/Bobra.0056s0086.2
MRHNTSVSVIISFHLAYSVLAVFKRLSELGIAVHSYDCHGHGQSEPKDHKDRVLFWRFTDVVDDLQNFAAAIRERYSGRYPMFIGGHSMGALTAIYTALRDQSVWSGVVVCSGALDVEWNLGRRILAFLGSIISGAFPRLRVVQAAPDQAALEARNAMLGVVGEGGHLEHHHLMTFVVNEYEDEVWPMRARTANEMVNGFAYVRAEGYRIRLPIYAHHGMSDSLAEIKAVKKFLGVSASRDVTFYEVLGGEHELLMGTKWQDLTDRIAAWIKLQSDTA